MVCREAERGGAIKHGSKMIQAVANVRVPKFTIVLGGSLQAELKALGADATEEQLAATKADWQQRHDAVIAVMLSWGRCWC